MLTTEYITIEGEPVRLEDGIDLRGEDLKRTRINNITLSNIDFSGADLSFADLSQTRFFHCNFQGANLEHVVALEAKFRDCNFLDARVKYAQIPISPEQFVTTHEYKTRKMFGKSYKAQGDDFSNFRFEDSLVKELKGCNLTDARFVGYCPTGFMTKEQLVSTYNYKNKEFTGLFSIGGDTKETGELSGLDFSHCYIGSLTFANYDVSGVDFSDAVIWNDLAFGGCVGLTIEQLESTWNWKNRRFNFSMGINFDWSGTDFSEFTFEIESCLGPGNVANADFTNARIIGPYVFQRTPDLTTEQIKSTWNFKNRELCFDLGNKSDRFQITELDWSGTDFSNFTFDWSNLNGSNVTDANFTNARFVRFYNLEDCKGLTIEQVKSTWNYKTGHVDDLTLPKAIREQLQAEKNDTDSVNTPVKQNDDQPTNWFENADELSNEPARNTDVIFPEECSYDNPLPSTRFVSVYGKPIRLEDGRSFRGTDLSGIRINNVTLSNVDFRGADLSGADLSQARFYHCNFGSARFNGAKADEAVFIDCNFENAEVTDASSFDLTREQFLSTYNYRNGFIYSVHFDDRQLDQMGDIDFSNCRLSNTSVINAQGCDFTNAIFEGHCQILNMTKEQLMSTKNYSDKQQYVINLTLQNTGNEPLPLSGVDLSKRRIAMLAFDYYDVSNADFTDALIWKNLCFNNCVGLSPEQLKSTANWKNRMYNFSLSNTELDWSNEDFTGFVFRNGGNLGSGSVAGANFTDARFGEDFDLENCRGLTIDQIKSTWNYKNNVMTMKLPKEIVDQLQAEKRTDNATDSNS